MDPETKLPVALLAAMRGHVGATYFFCASILRLLYHQQPNRALSQEFPAAVQEVDPRIARGNAARCEAMSEQPMGYCASILRLYHQPTRVEVTSQGLPLDGSRSGFFVFAPFFECLDNDMNTWSEEDIRKAEETEAMCNPGWLLEGRQLRSPQVG